MFTVIYGGFIGMKASTRTVYICRNCAHISNSRKLKLLKCRKCGARMLIVKHYLLNTIKQLIDLGIMVLYVESQDFTHYGQVSISLAGFYDDIFLELPDGYIYCDSSADIDDYFLSSPLVSICDIDGDSNMIQSMLLTDNRHWYTHLNVFSCKDIYQPLESWLNELDKDVMYLILSATGRI